jgi:hypothetical protein
MLSEFSRKRLPWSSGFICGFSSIFWCFEAKSNRQRHVLKELPLPLVDGAVPTSYLISVNSPHNFMSTPCSVSLVVIYVLVIIILIIMSPPHVLSLICLLWRKCFAALVLFTGQDDALERVLYLSITGDTALQDFKSTMCFL